MKLKPGNYTSAAGSERKKKLEQLYAKMNTELAKEMEKQREEEKKHWKFQKPNLYKG